MQKIDTKFKTREIAFAILLAAVPLVGLTQVLGSPTAHADTLTSIPVNSNFYDFGSQTCSVAGWTGAPNEIVANNDGTNAYAGPCDGKRTFTTGDSKIILNDSPDYYTSNEPYDYAVAGMAVKGPAGRTVRIILHPDSGNSNAPQSFTSYTLPDNQWHVIQSAPVDMAQGSTVSNSEVDFQVDAPDYQPGDVFYIDDVGVSGGVDNGSCGLSTPATSSLGLLSTLNFAADSISNCSFEGSWGTAGWNNGTDGSNSTLYSSTGAEAGSLSAGLKNNQVGGGTITMNDSPDSRGAGDILPSFTRCTASAYVKASSASDTGKIQLRQYSNSGTLRTSGASTPVALSTSSWTQISYTVTLASYEANDHLDLNIIGNTGYGDYLSIDNVHETCQ